jgi:MYXO-CTERM domain-containing protein
MWSKLACIVSTVLMAIVLTFAPVFAQETRDLGDDTRTTASAADEGEGPDLGWLGLIGLLGLAGLMKRDRVNHDRSD